MSDQAESQRTRNCTSVLYMPTRTAAITTRITRRIIALINVSSGIIGTVAQRGRRRNHGWLARYSGLFVGAAETGVTAGVRSSPCGRGLVDLSLMQKSRSSDSGHLHQSYLDGRKPHTDCVVRLQSPRRSA